MMNRALIAFLMTILCMTTMRSQIVINEIIPPGTIEIITQGATPVNIEGFYLGSGSNHIALADLQINCGEFILEQGEFFVVEGFNVIDPADGEMGLFITNDFNDPDDIIDYVEWGSSGHTHSGIAQLAGVWPVGDFVEDWSECVALEYEGTGDGDIHWTSVLVHSECAENVLDPCMVSLCEITSTGLDNVLCNNNETFDLPGDDYITFQLDPDGIDLGESYTVSVMPGTVFPTMAEYGTPTTFQMQNGSAGGGNVQVTITDNDESTCSFTFMLEDPGSCSENCNIYESGIFNLTCDDNGTQEVYNDDRITFQLDPLGFNTGDEYEIEVDPGDVSPDIGQFNSTTMFTMQPGSAGGGDVDALLRDIDIPSCAHFFVIEDPGACSLCLVDGGVISTEDSTMVCSGDDFLDVVDFQLENSSGTFDAWVQTTPGGTIISLEAPPFEFDQYPAGNVIIRHISYEFDLQGLEVGEDIDDLEGCYDFSNPVTVNVFQPSPALIGTTDNNTLCTIDGVSDEIDINVSGGVGSHTIFMITDLDGVILFLTEDNPIDFEGTGGGTCRIRLLHYEEGIEGLAPGNNIEDLEGCYAWSNFLNIFRIAPMAGTISTNDTTTVCVDDGVSDPINVMVEGAMGGTQGWIIADNTGVITGLPAGPPFNFEGSGPGTSLIYHIRYQGAISGLEEGSQVGDLGGCYQLSNTITITRIVGEACNPCQVDGGMIATPDPTTVCAGDGDADLINVELNGAEGDIMRWIIAEPAGNILAIQISPPFNFDNIQVPLSFIYHISYEAGLEGLLVGGDLDELDGCFELSNAISIEALNPEGGVISTMDTTTVCTDDGSPDLININLTGAVGSGQGWVLTDGSGVIFSLPSGSPFNLEGTGSGIARIYHVRYESGFSGLFVGNNIANLSGCYELSNAIPILRLTGDNCTSSTIDLSLSNHFDLVPNPAKHTVFLKSELLTVEELRIIDLLGHEVMYLAMPQDGEVIDIGSIAKGMYVVQIRTGSAFGLKKLMIH